MNKDIKRFYLIRAFKFLTATLGLMVAFFGARDNATDLQTAICLPIVIACAIGFFSTFVLSDRVNRRLSE